MALAPVKLMVFVPTLVRVAPDPPLITPEIVRLPVPVPPMLALVCNATFVTVAAVVLLLISAPPLEIPVPFRLIGNVTVPDCTSSTAPLPTVIALPAVLPRPAALTSWAVPPLIVVLPVKMPP